MSTQRELELQTIVKTLESKLQAQRAHIQMLQKQEQDKIRMAIHKERSIISEKDKTIAMLIEEGQKNSHNSNFKHSRNIALIEDQYRSREETNVKLQTNKMELESKLVEVTKYNQDKMKEKNRQIEQYKNQVKKLQKERKIMIEEVQKINKFSVEVAKRQPQKEQTLLWVNKLIAFMEKTSEMANNQSKQRQQALLNITLHVSQQLRQLNEQYSKNDSVVFADKLKFTEEMQNMIFHVKEDCKEAMRTNQDFWEHFVKIRNKEDKQYIGKLEGQIQHNNEQKEKQIQEMQEQLASSQKQKKNLIVSLQQLKCYYQLRQKANREEVDHLKRAIEDLIQSQELRQKEYEKELERMGNQIEHLTVKFYQKIQLPINTVYNKIKDEVGNFQQKYQGFFTSDQVKRQIVQFQDIIVEYLVKLNNEKELRDSIKEAAKQNLKISQFLAQNHQGHHEFGTSRIDHNMSFSFSSVFTQENKEQDKKLVYELATARKQIEKLKQHNRNVQGRAQPNKATTTLMNIKMVQLAAENEALKEQLIKLERSHKEKVAHNQKILEESKIGKINTALLEQILQKNTEILKYNQIEDQYIQHLSKCVNSLNIFLLSPAQTFQKLIDEIKNISAPIFESPHLHKNDSIPSLAEVQTKRIVYQEIATRKNDANVSIQKASAEMTKIIRQMLSKNNNSSKHIKISEAPPQNDRPKFIESRQMLEKRLKDVHMQRMKIREEMLEKIVFLDEKLKHIESKHSKKQNFPFIKFQESICKKLTEMFGSIGPKDKLKDFKKVTEDALNDATSKLIESQLQNQGLLKEIKMLKALNK